MRGQIKQGWQPVSRLNSQRASRAEERMGHTNMAAFQLPTTYQWAAREDGKKREESGGRCTPIWLRSNHRYRRKMANEARVRTDSEGAREASPEICRTMFLSRRVEISREKEVSQRVGRTNMARFPPKD